MKGEQTNRIIYLSLAFYVTMTTVLSLVLNVTLFLSTKSESESIVEHFSVIRNSNLLYFFVVSILVYLCSVLVISILYRRLHFHVVSTREELMKLADEAETANTAKTNFLANMSHEIRTPLNAIIGFSDILNASDLPSTEKDYAGVVARSAKSLLAIINDILDISKIESDVFDINNEPFEIEPFLENIIELYSVKSDEKKVQLTYYFDQSIPSYLIGDSFRLQQVVSNLLSNAIKFTPQKGLVQFKTLLLHGDEQKVTLRFTVKDNGIGISEEGQKKIFEPFTQADNSITRKFGGTGLGLSISRKIVHAMNSELKLTSELYKGSLFSFDVDFQVDLTRSTRKFEHKQMVFGIYPAVVNDTGMRDRLISVLSNYGEVVKDANELYYENINILVGVEVDNIYLETRRMKDMYPNVPIIYANKELHLSQVERDIFYDIIREPYYKSKIEKIIGRAGHVDREDDSEGTKDVTFNGTVLVAEDNTMNQILMRVLLERLGVNMVFADNGVDAIEKFKENEVDLVLMDIHMPVLDGVAAMKDIRNLKGGPETPIIALTADALKGDRETYLAEGMDDYLSKPVTYSDLVIKFYDFLEVAKSNRKGNILGGAKDFEYNDKGVMTKENSVGWATVESQEDVNEGISADEKATKEKPVSCVDKEFYGDESLSFKERVEFKKEMELKARIADKAKDREMKRAGLTEHPAKKEKFTTVDNYMRKLEKQDAKRINPRGTVGLPDKAEEKPQDGTHENQVIAIADFDYDRDSACKHIGVDMVTLEMLLDNFALTYSKGLEKIQQALESEDLEEVRRTTHYLKGSAANLQMISLIDVLKKVEINAKNGIISQVDFVSIQKYIESAIH